MDNKLKKQIEKLHNEERYGEIINALEQVPVAMRDYETILLLARAYNNVNDCARAEKLLETISEEGEEDEVWNFEMGYSQYYLDNNIAALQFLNKAYELNPEDEVPLFFIRQCNIEMPLAKRVEKFWDWFEVNEKRLPRMLQPRSQEESESFMAFVQEGTSLISENIYFNVGVDYEFTFSVEGWPDLFILYPYIISRMPENLKAKWKFNPFNQAMNKSFGFRMYGKAIDTEHVMVHASYLADTDSFRISYFETNLNSLPEDESDNAVSVIIDNTLGEGISFKYLGEVSRARKLEMGMFPLPELKEFMKETVERNGRQFYENPKDFYSNYRLKPQKSDVLRYDINIGTTCFKPILIDYYNGSTQIFDHINTFGAQAVFIVFKNVNGSDVNDMLRLRHEIEDRMTHEILEPMKLGQVIGGAFGTNHSYIDLIVFDYFTFVEMVKSLLEQYPEYTFYLSDFRRDSELTLLKEAE